AVDLEVDVRPAARVAAGEHGREGDLPLRVGLLHAPQPVLLGGTLRVQRVGALPVAVPDVDRGALPGRTAVTGRVDDGERHGQRDALGGAARGVAEAGADVGADDSALLEH